MKKAFPFRFDPTAKKNLSAQLADGIRLAIAEGRYAAGDVLPGVREWAERLGVSVRVPQRAYARLADEGLVVSRPRLGCVVSGNRRPRWRGHVLLILPFGDYSFFFNILAGRLRSSLLKAGYLVTAFTLPTSESRAGDLDVLKCVLGQSFDLVVLLTPLRTVERLLSKSGYPFVVLSPTPCRDCGCVGTVRFSMSSTLPEFVRHCTAVGARRVVQVGKGRLDVDARPALEAAGIAVEDWQVKVPDARGRIEDLQRATYDAAVARLARERKNLPDVFFVPDDYQAQAFLAALSDLRIRIPEETGVVVWANRGNGPVFRLPLTRFEADPAAFGETIAHAVLASFARKSFPADMDVRAAYVIGDTFPAA